MKLKLRFALLRRQLVDGVLTETKPQLAIALSWILNFVLGLVLAAVPLFGGSGPFGIAFVARASAGLSGLMAALGAALGYLAFFGFREGIKAVAALVLVFTTLYVFQDSKLARRSFFMPAIAAFFTLLTVFLGYYTAEAGSYMLLPLLAQTVLAYGCTYFYREALRTDEPVTEAAELRRGIALLLLLSCVLMALSGALILNIVSLGRVASILLVLAAAGKGGALCGAAAGIVLGGAMDAVSGLPVFYSLCYALSALTSGVFSRHGRLLFLLSYILCGALCAILCAGSGLRVELLYENFVAAVIYLVLPNSLLNQIGMLLKSAQSSTGESGLRRYTAHRVRQMAEAFSDLYSTVDSTLSVRQKEETLPQAFDRAAEQVCCKCKNKTECWNGSYMDTLSVFNDLSEPIRANGILHKEDLPKHFLERCLMPGELVSAVNGELRGQMYRRQYFARMQENTSAAYAQYQDLSEILSGVSDELLNAYGPDPLAQRRLARYLGAMDIDADIAVFRDRTGRLHIVLESVKLQKLMEEPGSLERLSEVVGVRLCRPLNRDAAAAGRITLLEAEPLSVSVGVASMKKAGEPVSGDRGTYFKTEQGMLCIILSDGMGSGESAAKESVAAIRILERFLRTGIEPMLAMKMLNSVMLLKNCDEWGFATVDLLCIDLFSGNAAFYKYGAAPSYVKSVRQIRRVRSQSLAAGLSTGANNLPDVIKMRLHPGNVALIASDGVLAETNDSWLRRLLSEADTDNMKLLARETLKTALKQYGASDDMTVLAVRLEKRD
ncbi:MAG: hypothetical protein E7427_06615 [Ruminococcaceae bacterium]|nr:hypothetical protein [Oscillospiraceae bacterium]